MPKYTAVIYAYATVETTDLDSAREVVKGEVFDRLIQSALVDETFDLNLELIDVEEHY